MWRLLFILLFPITVSSQLKRFEFSEIKMGSTFNLIFYHTDSLDASAIAKECYLLVDSLNDIFSDYSPSSETGRLSLMPGVKEHNISDELFKMILRSKQAWKRSKKSFDITIGTLTQLWRKAKKENRPPSESEIKKAKEQTGFANILINEINRTVTIKKPGIRFDFGGIVPGYAAQKVLELLKEKKINIALVDASGDIVTGDPPPGTKGWIVAINLPESENEVWDKKLELKNFAVATSGDIYRYIIHDGKKYSHILDPRTGLGTTSQRNVTVIAKDGADADWLATAFSILPEKKVLRLARKEQVAVFMAILKNEKIEIYKSKNFDRFFQQKKQ